MLIDTRAAAFDMQGIRNRRFMYSPQSRMLILGRQYKGGSMQSSHAEEHRSTGTDEPYDDFVRGWVGTGRHYKDGVVHFAPCIDTQDIDRFNKGYDTLRMFSENGANGNTVIRGFGNTWEQPLSVSLSKTDERERTMSEQKRGPGAAPIVLKADNPREKLKEITDRLEQGIKELFESERYKSYLKTLSKFHSYSFNNCMLIAMQKPDATHVAGYSSWQHNFKRNVRQGEKGIKIIAPAPFKDKREQDRLDKDTGKPIIGADGKALKEEVEVTVPAFKVVSVFDLSQTDGEPLPEIGTDELTGSVDKYNDFLEALQKTSPVPIEFEDITSGAKGYYDQTERRIAINQGMSELQMLKTAIHELAHARLHAIDKDAPKGAHRPDQDTREVEAESVAYTVCAHYGLDTSDYSFGYIAGWSGTKELDVLKASLDTIRTEADAIIREADTHMALLTKNREDVMKGLQGEVKATLQFFVDSDIKDKGALSPSTSSAIAVQGYQYADGALTRLPAPPVPESPIKTAELSTEQNLNMIDGTLNNRPTVSELEAKAKSGEAISLTELAGAMKAERTGQPERRSADAGRGSQSAAARKSAWSAAQSQQAWDHAQGRGAKADGRGTPSIREQLNAGKEQLSREKLAVQRTAKTHEREV
jgi:antirestriction protein ArdC